MAHAALRVFLSPPDSFGFGALDYFLASISVLLCLPFGLLGRRAIFYAPPSQSLRKRTFLILTLLVACLPVAFRLCLLQRHPVPVGSGADDFSYLLLADTLFHGRLANPPLRFPAFFEQIFVLQSPTHSSIYPLGQGLLLAAGQALLHLPWAGILASASIFTGLLIWALRGYVGDRWALLGGLIAVAHLGPLCYWMNCYWGGYLSGIAGCLVFGSLGRSLASREFRSMLPLGLGLAIQLLTRPFEFLLLLVCVAGSFAVLLFRSRPFRARWRLACLIVLGILLPAMALVLMQNVRVTGNVWTLPYQAYRRQYGVPATFTFQRNPIPSRVLNEEQEQDYRAECTIHGEARDSLPAYGKRLLERARFLRFFLPPAGYGLSLLGLLLPCRRRLVLPLGSLGIFVLGSSFYPYFYPHYVAALTPLILLLPLLALESMEGGSHDKLRNGCTRLILPAFITLLLGPFVLWYGLRLGVATPSRDHLLAFETWDFLNGPDPQGRTVIAQHLAATSGKQLVFVQYSPGHAFAEWVHNGADVDSAQTIYAHDEGSAANNELRTHYPDRHAWLLQPDFEPPRLTPLTTSTLPFENVP